MLHAIIFSLDNSLLYVKKREGKMNIENIPLYIELLIFTGWLLLGLAFGKYLNHRFGAKRKTRFKRALFELYAGVACIFCWLVFKWDWLMIGIPGIIGVFRALGQLAYFAIKRIPDGTEKTDTTFY